LDRVTFLSFFCVSLFAIFDHFRALFEFTIFEQDLGPRLLYRVHVTQPWLVFAPLSTTGPNHAVEC
jgi:hypothetical protein